MKNTFLLSIIFTIIYFFVLGISTNQITGNRITGEGKRKEGVYNVHLVCHTHDDVGWLKTVDQYYYGANNSIQDAGVQYILDSVIPQLVENPNRKFIYVEQAFFQRWWNEQDSVMQGTVKKLVQTGQLEFINGGWCMHDEASTHYVAMIDQTTLGHRRLFKQFGVVPTIGWQIDPFGHSSTQAALLSARVGFKALFFARIDYEDQARRNRDKEFEFIWRPSPSLGLKGQVFTGAFERNGYGPPDKFNWDSGSGDAPIQDDPNLHDYNVQSRVDEFVDAVMDQFSVNQGSDIMFTLGSDFQYSNAHTWYKNLDKLIYYLNKDGRVNAFYSTPSEYVKAKLNSPIQWTVKTDDFFPYADCPHCYWTGYFTSRPALKRYVRINSGYLNTARQIEIASYGDGNKTKYLEEAVGVAQHHDAVSGTSKQHVAYDYAQRIAKGANIAADMINTAFTSFVSDTNNTPPFTQCMLLNESVCLFTQQNSGANKGFVVVVYNPLGHLRNELIKLPVTGSNGYTVYNFRGLIIPSQTAASFSPFPKITPAPFILYFIAQDVPPLGFTTYFVQPNSNIYPEFPVIPKDDISIENSFVRVIFSTTTGRLSTIINKVTGISTTIDQNFLWYSGAQESFNDQNTGAYIFRPNSTTAYPACSGIPKLAILKGSVVQEIRSVVCDWVAQTVRLTGNESFVEFEYQIGEVPIKDGYGKEVISQFSTDVASNSLFYTDSNGREFQTRKRNYRPTWNLTVTEPIAGNYYPVNTAAYIKDNIKQFSILNDRSQGGSSLKDGSFELMIHRRLLYDDGRGVGEPLNETDGISPYPYPKRLGNGLHITGSHYIFIDPPTAAFKNIRRLQARVFLPFTVLFNPLGVGVDAIKQWLLSHYATGSLLQNPLLDNIDIMTFQAIGANQYLLRLSHQYAVGEDTTLSNPATVNLTALFTFPLYNLKEVSLTANQNPQDAFPLKWKVFGKNADVNSHTYPFKPFDGEIVTIDPMDIRTFTFSVFPEKKNLFSWKR